MIKLSAASWESYKIEITGSTLFYCTVTVKLLLAADRTDGSIWAAEVKDSSSPRRVPVSLVYGVTVLY